METSMCRTCLMPTGESIFKTIGIDQEQISLVEMLNECTGLNVTKSDGISLNICDNCTYKIINSYLYRRKCWESQNFLLRRLEETRVFKSEDFVSTPNIKDEQDNTYVSRNLMITPISNIRDLDEIEYTPPNYEAVSDSEIIADPLLFESDEDNAPNEPILKSEMSIIESVKCETCMKTYSSQNLLLNHLREFHNLCEDVNSEECKLERHSETPYEVNNTLPGTKLESFNSVQNLQHDSPNIGLVKCEVCDKTFARKTLMARHMRDIHKIYAPRLKYECKYCKKLVGRLCNLERHIRFAHEQPQGPRKYICHFCGLVVRNATNFKRHVRRHTGEKPYKCDYCDYRATNGTSVHIHMRTHTGDRPYKCVVCDKEFKTASSFANHRSIHSDETSFECSVCSRKFKQRSTWREHVYSHDPDRYVECNICGKKFVTRFKLKRHMRQHET